MAAKEIAVKKYVVKLSTEERERLEMLLRVGKHPAQRLTTGCGFPKASNPPVTL